jgi:hypothetical protein
MESRDWRIEGAITSQLTGMEGIKGMGKNPTAFRLQPIQLPAKAGL